MGSQTKNSGPSCNSIVEGATVTKFRETLHRTELRSDGVCRAN